MDKLGLHLICENICRDRIFIDHFYSPSNKYFADAGIDTLSFYVVGKVRLSDGSDVDKVFVRYGYGEDKVKGILTAHVVLYITV